MALRNRNPGEPRKSDQPTRRVASKFMGMISGEPDSKVSPNFATLIENMIDRGEYSTVRPGSKQYSTAPLRYAFVPTGIGDHYLNITGNSALNLISEGEYVYFIGDDLPAPLQENTPYLLTDGYADPYNLRYGDNSGYVDFTDLGSGNMYICRGPLYAKCDHVKAGLIIWMFGRTVLVSNKAISSFTKVNLIAEYLGTYPDYESTIIPFGDNAILLSKNGIFKIVLNESFYYMHVINLPSSQTLITDVAATVTKIYGYLYNYSSARIIGATGNINRVSDGAVLTMETGTNLVDGEEKDYGEVYFDSEVGEDVTVEHSVGNLQIEHDNSYGITHFPLYRTKDIGAGGSSSGLTGVGNRRDQLTWVEDVPVCKALIVDTTTPGQITASSGTFVRGDVGSRISISKGASKVDCTISGYTSPAVVTITGTPPSSTTAVGVIGGFRGGTATQAVDGLGRNILTLTADYSGFNGYSTDDAGKMFFISDGTVRHIKRQLSQTTFEIIESTVFAGLAVGISNNSANTYAYQRKWNDTVPDIPQADGRVSLQDRIDHGTDLYVPRRFFRPLPNSDIGLIDNGFLVCAERENGEYHYCQTGDKPYCIGQYKYPEQFREIVGSISHIKGYPFMALVTMYDKTGIITLSSSQNIGRIEIGENIFQLPEMSVVDEKHGVIAFKTLTYKNNNVIFAITSDSALRYFSGTAWSREDLAFINGLDAVSKKYLKKTEHQYIKAASYNFNGGLKIWFQMLVSGVLTDMCLRYATEPGEGYGWSLITGDDWVFPIDENGVFDILDDNDIQRVLVIDKNDYCIYEIDTFDRSTVVIPPALDKEDVEDTEIIWKRRGIEHIAAIGSENKRLVHERSYVNIEPVDVANRGATGYTATGQRDAQELTLKTFSDGERTDESARASDFPENGEVVFSGRKRDANKILMELSGTAGEINITGMTDIFMIEERAPTIARRTMTEHTIALALLAGKALHICKSESLYNRVTQADLGGGTVTKTDGPDGKEDSGFVFTEDVTCDNAALTAYTIVLWSKDANLFTGIAGWTAYGAAVNTWQMYYLTGANLPAAVVMEAGTKFDIRIYNKVLTVAQIALLREDTVDFEGKMLLPGFIGD